VFPAGSLQTSCAATGDTDPARESAAIVPATHADATNQMQQTQEWYHNAGYARAHCARDKSVQKGSRLDPYLWKRETATMGAGVAAFPSFRHTRLYRFAALDQRAAARHGYQVERKRG
jgi:hypothetical protein